MGVETAVGDGFAAEDWISLETSGVVSDNIGSGGMSVEDDKLEPVTTPAGSEKISEASDETKCIIGVEIA